MAQIKNKFKFSVIMCNYNYGRYIAKAIDSVLNQTFKDFELIIVDDGSTDDSREIISSFTDTRIKTVFKENGGQASAFNAGFDVATGKLIALIDSDDWWALNKLEVVWNYHRLSKCKIALYQHLVDDDSNGKRKPYKNILPSGDIWTEIKETSKLDYFIPTSGFVIPYHVCEKVFPIPEEFWYSADGFLMRTTILFGKMLGIPEVLAFHRMHEDSFNSTVLKDQVSYINGLLKPQLNKYYQDSGIDFQFIIKSKEFEDKPSLFYMKKKQLKSVLQTFMTLLFKW